MKRITRSALALIPLSVLALSGCSESNQAITCKDFDTQVQAREVFAQDPGHFAPETIDEHNVLCGDLPATNADFAASLYTPAPEAS